MPETLVTIVYLVAGILFIQSLGGLSAQESARRGNLFGMIGMALAVAVTAFGPHVTSYGVLIAALVVGGGIGAALAARVEMTAMPQMVAMLHSFVGLAAVLVGFGGTLAPSGLEGVEARIHEVEIYVGVFIGAVTFTGSVIAFGKLQGLIRQQAAADAGPPPDEPGRHAGLRVAGLAVRGRAARRGADAARDLHGDRVARSASTW